MRITKIIINAMNKKITDVENIKNSHGFSSKQKHGQVDLTTEKKGLCCVNENKRNESKTLTHVLVYELNCTYKNCCRKLMMNEFIPEKKNFCYK